jgi:hypothetical protein
VQTLGAWFNPVEGSVYSQTLFPLSAEAAPAPSYLWNFSDATLNNEYGSSYVQNSDYFALSGTKNGSSLGMAIGTAGSTAGTADKVAASFSNQKLSISNSNSLGGTVNASTQVPTITQFNLGSDAVGAQQLGAALQKIDDYKQALSPLALKSLSQ